MKTRIITAIVALIVFLPLLFLGGDYFKFTTFALGVMAMYEIVRMRTITGKEAKQDEGADAMDDLRLAFELRFSRQLYKEYRMIDVLKMTDLTFLDTTFSDIDGYVSLYI